MHEEIFFAFIVISLIMSGLFGWLIARDAVTRRRIEEMDHRSDERFQCLLVQMNDNRTKIALLEQKIKDCGILDRRSPTLDVEVPIRRRPGRPPKVREIKNPES